MKMMLCAQRRGIVKHLCSRPTTICTNNSTSRISELRDAAISIARCRCLAMVTLRLLPVLHRHNRLDRDQLSRACDISHGNVCSWCQLTCRNQSALLVDCCCVLSDSSASSVLLIQTDFIYTSRINLISQTTGPCAGTFDAPCFLPPIIERLR